MTEVRTGLDVIRGTLRARRRAGHLAPIARDIGTGIADLEDFADGRRDLPAAVLAALVKDLFHGQAEYDATLNLMRPVNRTPPVSMGIAPAPFDPRTSPYAYKPGPPALGPQPVKALPAKPKTPRPGWLNSWL